ncbi:uncharacterized protein [Dermacentor andersoni]|uniref:uncharacterized protein n=1 Tax=Dermacentor andersoni TaxID=34620 RepID=UPI0024178DDD|nr:uncharacterized protein LOC126526011 [Dermacentor andersoni]
MGARLNSTQMFPPDGLCEYIFFDSLYKDGRNPLNAPGRYDSNLQTFLGAATAHQITAFGIAISYDASHSLETLLNNRTGSFKPLRTFWDHSIYHFGILDTATVNPRESDVIPALRCLKLLREHYSKEIIDQGLEVFTFFAASAPDDAWATFYMTKFMNLFAPDLFIGVGHYPRGDNTLPGCFIVPPTLLQKPREIGDSYQHDLTTAFESFPRLSMSTLTLKYALSVTMKGRLAVPKVSAQYGFFAPCITNDSIDSFASVTDVSQTKHSPHRRWPAAYVYRIYATLTRTPFSRQKKKEEKSK